MPQWSEQKFDKLYNISFSTWDAKQFPKIVIMQQWSYQKSVGRGGYEQIGRWGGPEWTRDAIQSWLAGHYKGILLGKPSIEN